MNVQEFDKIIKGNNVKKVDKEKEEKEEKGKGFLKVLEMQRASEERLLELGISGELDCTQNEKGTQMEETSLKENKKNYVGINFYSSLSEKDREALNPLIEHLEKRKQFSENILKNCGNKQEEQRLLVKNNQLKKGKIIFNIQFLF